MINDFNKLKLDNTNKLLKLINPILVNFQMIMKYLLFYKKKI